jgi:hypothetical protein
MLLKQEIKYELVGFIEDAETKRISLVGHAANEMPFAVVKSEDGIDWVTQETHKTELKALASKADVAPSQIKFPLSMSEDDVKAYMGNFEDSSYTISKTDEGYVAKSKIVIDSQGNRIVILPSGIAYTLNKFNLSDTMKTEKELSQMSKKETKKSEAVETNDSKDKLIAALKGLSKEDMIAILDEVLPEETVNTEAKEEAEPGEKQGSEELVEVEAKEEVEAVEIEKEETAEVIESEKVEEVVEVKEAKKSTEISKDLADAISEEFEAQAEITKALSEDVKALNEKLDALVEKFEATSTKLEKSLDSEEAIEVIAELQESIDSLSKRLESLEYAPADSTVIEKSAEVSGESKGFLAKFL